MFSLLRWLTSADCFETPNLNFCESAPILINGALYLFKLLTSHLSFGRLHPRSETGDDDGTRVLSLENVVPWFFIASCAPIFVDWLIWIRLYKPYSKRPHKNIEIERPKIRGIRTHKQTCKSTTSYSPKTFPKLGGHPSTILPAISCFDAHFVASGAAITCAQHMGSG